MEITVKKDIQKFFSDEQINLTILCQSLSVWAVSHQLLLERQILRGILFAMVIIVWCN